MIYIELDKLADLVPSAWLEKADALTRQLKSESDSARRKKLVSDSAEMWREVKSTLRSFGHEKCWYCESLDIRSDNAVDHFRPKGRVEGAGKDSGYWWLAFDLQNYRFSCTFCNSRRVDAEGETAGGKQDAFPLIIESARVTDPSGDLEDESPVLIDPCCLPDIDLLWFEANGQVAPNPATAVTLTAQRRVTVSVELYHLDHVKLVEARRRVYYRVRRMLRTADRLFVKWRQGDESAKSDYSSLLVEIRSLVLRDSEHSAAARCALLTYRANSGAADAVLRTL